MGELKDLSYVDLYRFNSKNTFIYDKQLNKKVEISDDLIVFFKDLEKVFEKHNMSLLENEKGIVIEEFDLDNLYWIMNAEDHRGFNNHHGKCNHLNWREGMNPNGFTGFED